EEVDGTLHPARVVHRLLRRHHLKAHPELGEVAILLGPLNFKNARPAAADALLVGKLGEGLALEGEHFPGVLFEVLAVVAALGNRQRVACELTHPSPQALGQPVNLHAGIVDVELAGNSVPGPLEERGDRVAQRGATTVTHMEWSCGVGGDELYVHPKPGTDGG